MFVLLYVHLKNDVFSISFPFPLYQGNTLSLTNVVTSLVDFLTACKRLWCLCIVAGKSDSLNPKIYYSKPASFLSSYCAPADSSFLEPPWSIFFEQNWDQSDFDLAITDHLLVSVVELNEHN